MEKCLVITNSNDEFLDRSAADFLHCWNVKMPKNVDLCQAETLLDEDNEEINFILSTQIMIYDLTTLMVKELGLHVLYEACYSSGNNLKSVLYSTPSEKGMYVIVVSSSCYGVVNNFDITFYNSVEMMYSRVKAEYDNMLPNIASIIKRQKPGEILSLFY